MFYVQILMYQILISQKNNRKRRTTARLSEVESDELNHVGLQQVDVPPGVPLRVGEGAGVRGERRGRRAVHGLLRDASLGHGRLHGRLPCGHIEHCGR